LRDWKIERVGRLGEWKIENGIENGIEIVIERDSGGVESLKLKG
jgi:hypothetical protein